MGQGNRQPEWRWGFRMRVEARAARRRGGMPIALSQIRRLSVNRGITAVRIADNYFCSASRTAKKFFLSGSVSFAHPALAAERERRPNDGLVFAESPQGPRGPWAH